MKEKQFEQLLDSLAASERGEGQACDGQQRLLDEMTAGYNSWSRGMHRLHAVLCVVAMFLFTAGAAACMPQCNFDYQRGTHARLSMEPYNTATSILCMI